MIATGSGPPTIVRIRRLLKAALRAYGLRCLRVSEEQSCKADVKPRLP